MRRLPNIKIFGNEVFLLNPFWLIKQVTFFWVWVVPLITAAAGYAGSAAAGSAQGKAVDKQNEANLESVRLQNQYNQEASDEQNRMSILQQLWNGGEFGGHNADLNYGRTKLQRTRANAFGLLPEARKRLDPAQFAANPGRYAEDPYLAYLDNDSRDVRNFLDLLGVDIGPKEVDPMEREDYLAEWRRVRALGDGRSLEQWVEDHENPTYFSQRPSADWDYTQRGWAPPKPKEGWLDRVKGNLTAPFRDPKFWTDPKTQFENIRDPLELYDRGSVEAEDTVNANPTPAAHPNP